MLSNKIILRKEWGFILVFVLVLGCSSKKQTRGDQVCFKNKCVNVEVVQTSEDVAKGLKFRKSLKENSGMFFIFSGTRKHAFWMKDTLIPLDMIWIDHARKVVHIEEAVLPCRKDPCPVYTPLSTSLYVLEVNAFYAKKIGIKEGEILDINIQTSLK